MRRVGKEGRAMVKSFSYPKSKDELIENIDESARREGLTFSDIVLESLDRWWLEHGKSQNPQTRITLFETGLENAIPNLYEIAKHPEKLKKFYNLIKRKEDYQELDRGINLLLNYHNRQLKRF